MNMHNRFFVLIFVLVSVIIFTSTAVPANLSHDFILHEPFITDNTINNPDPDYSYLIASERNYIPEISLVVSMDKGANWTQNTKNLTAGVPFLLMIEASVRVPGLRLQLFGANSIETTLFFPLTEIDPIDWELVDNDISINEIAVEAHEDSGGGWAYIFKVPTSPVDDNALARGVKPQKVTLTFSCTPKKPGSQPILVWYEDRVSDTYQKAFTLTVN